MTLQRIPTALLLIVFLAGCTPAATFAPSDTPQPTLTLTAVPTATETVTPTAIPKISLPVDRFHALPQLSQITSENISELEPVASYSEAQLIEVAVSDTQDRALVVYNTGVQIYDLPDLNPRLFLPIDLAEFHAYRLSSTGKHLAVITRELPNQVQVWDLDSQEKTCVLEFPSKINPGIIMDFFPETNRFLFSGSWMDKDKSGSSSEIRLLDLDNCQEVFSIPSASNNRLSFSVSPDGRNVTYRQDQQVVVQNVESNSITAYGDTANVRGAAFTADSASIIISYSNNTKIYDLASGEITNEFQSNQGRDEVFLYPLADGKRVLIAGEENNRIWDTETNTSFALGPEYITSYRSLFDDLNGALVTHQSVWNLNRKNRVDLTKYSYGRQLSALSPDASFLAVNSGYVPYQTDLFDTASSRIILSLPGERAPVAVDGETFITSGDGQIFVHDFASGELLDTLQGEYMNGRTLTGRQVLLWDVKGNISILDMDEGSTLQQAALPIFPMEYGKMPDLNYKQNNFPAWEEGLGYDPSAWLASSGQNMTAVSPDYKTGIKQSGDIVSIFSITGDSFFPTQENLLASDSFKGFFQQFRFSSDGKMIVGAIPSQLIIWDSQTGKQIKAVTGKKYLQGQTSALGFSPDGSKVFISMFGEGSITLHILDVKTGELLQSQDTSGCNLNLPYAFTPDGTQIFTITPDCRIGLYNLSDWHEVKSFGGPYSGAKLALALSPDGKLLATGQKQTLEVWDVGSGRLIKSVHDLDTNIVDYIGGFALTFSPDGKLLAVRYGRWIYLGSTVTLFGVPVAP